MDIRELPIECFIDYDDKELTKQYLFKYYEKTEPYCRFPIDIYELLIDSYVDKLFLMNCLEKQIKKREINNI